MRMINKGISCEQVTRTSGNNISSGIYVYDANDFPNETDCMGKSFQNIWQSVGFIQVLYLW